MLNKPNETKAFIVNWIKDYFLNFAPEASAVVGISGGKDSSVTAALCVEALGKKRVIGVTMPNGVQPDIDDSNMLIEHLGISHISLNIQDAMNALEQALLQDTCLRDLTGNKELTRQTQINMQPRIRMTALYAVAQMLPNGGLVVNTCNRSEDYVGYSTKYGDAAGDLSPLGDYTVREVLQLGEALNLPKRLIYKAPSDGLSGLSDEDNLGFSYAVLDDYIERGVCPDSSVQAKIDRLHLRNLHKLQPIPHCSRPKEETRHNDCVKEQNEHE